MLFTYVLYIIHIIILLITITLPLHNRCMLQYTIFIPLIYYIFYIMNGDGYLIHTSHSKINNQVFIPGTILNITGINISDKSLDIMQNVSLSVLSLLAGFKLTATSQNDDTYKFFTGIYNTLGRY
jgi:hypothetical protein